MIVKNELIQEMNNANSYAQWLKFASELDNLEGNIVPFKAILL